MCTTLAHPPETHHKRSSYEMAEPEKTLRLHKTIGYDTYDSGHEDGNDTLDSIEPGYLVAHTCLAEVVTH